MNETHKPRKFYLTFAESVRLVNKCLQLGYTREDLNKILERVNKDES